MEQALDSSSKETTKVRGKKMSAPWVQKKIIAEEMAGRRFTKHSRWLTELDRIRTTSTDPGVALRADSLGRALITIINIRQAPGDRQHEYHGAKVKIGKAITQFLEENQ